MILALVIFFSGTVFFAQSAKAQSFNIGLRGGIVLQDVEDEILIGDMPKVSLGFSSDMFTLDFTYQWTGIRDWDIAPPKTFEHIFEADLGFSKAITDYFNFKAKSKLDIVIHGDTAADADDRYVEYKYEKK